MGMMDSKNWKGTWISDTRDIEMKEAPYFRKEFIIKKKNKKSLGSTLVLLDYMNFTLMANE